MSGGVTRPRAVLLGAAALALAAFALPSSASASFDPEFSVLSKDVRFHEIPNGFVGRTVLLNPANQANQVGHGKVRCVLIERSDKARCRALYHFDGSIGGFGDLLVKGNVLRGDHTLNVVDGSGDFSGAITGKAFIHNLARSKNQIDFHLTR